MKGKLQLVSQMGYKNARAVLDWVKKNYPSVDSLVIMGSSAGGRRCFKEPLSRCAGCVLLVQHDPKRDPS